MSRQLLRSLYMAEVNRKMGKKPNVRKNKRVRKGGLGTCRKTPRLRRRFTVSKKK